MLGTDRVFSVRTFLQAAGIIVAAAAIALAANGTREKQVDLDRQYFPAAVKAAQAREGTTARAPEASTPAGVPPANATERAAAPPDPAATPPATAAAPVKPPAPPAAEPAKPAPPPAPANIPPERPAPADGIQRMTLEDCRDLVGSPVAVFVDARDRDFYVAGHILGAVHLHHYESAKHIESVRPILEAAFMVIVYCNGGDCEDSINLALDLVGSYGLPNENVYVFEGGMDEWKAAKLPIVQGENRE